MREGIVQGGELKGIYDAPTGGDIQLHDEEEHRLPHPLETEVFGGLTSVLQDVGPQPHGGCRPRARNMISRGWAECLFYILITLVKFR